MPVSLERLWQDLRYGWRLLAANPGFTIVAVLSLAIGIGANCAIFSFADALVLRPLPVPRPGEVYTVGWSTPVEAFGATAITAVAADCTAVPPTTSPSRPNLWRSRGSTSAPVSVYTESVTDPLPTAAVSYVPATSGTYYLRITDAAGGGGPGFTYVIEKR